MWCSHVFNFISEKRLKLQVIPLRCGNAHCVFLYMIKYGEIALPLPPGLPPSFKIVCLIKRLLYGAAAEWLLLNTPADLTAQKTIKLVLGQAVSKQIPYWSCSRHEIR